MFRPQYPLLQRRRALGLVSELVVDLRGVRLVGCAAGDLFPVACGSGDVFVGFGFAEWDTAAGVAVVTAAGGDVARLPGPGFDILVAGAPAVVGDLTTRLAELVASASQR